MSNQIRQGFAKRCQTIGVCSREGLRHYLQVWYDQITLYRYQRKNDKIYFFHFYLTFIKGGVGNAISRPFSQQEGVP